MNLSPSLGAGALQFSSRMAVPAIETQPQATVKHNWAGYGTLRGAMEFMKWAIEQDRFPSIQATQARFNVCRATAYRWTSALAETYGVDAPLRHRPGDHV